MPEPSTAGQVLTLPGLVARVLGNNSGLEIARQRLQRAQESINQVNAQTRPQFRLNANNTYSSYPAFPAALPVPTITTPTLPDGGQIPTVTDQANSFSTTFIGSAGFSPGGGSISPGVAGGTGTVGGTAGVTGSTSTGTGTASPPAPAAAPGGTSGVGTSSNGAAGPAAPTGASGAATQGTGGQAGVGTGAAGGAGAPGNSTPGTEAPRGGGTPAVPATGAGAGGAGAGGAGMDGRGAEAPGLTLLAYPAIVGPYVADVRTLLQPPSGVAAVPVVRVRRADARENEAGATQGAAPLAREGFADDDPTAGGGPVSGPTGSTATPARGKRDTYATGGNVTQYIDIFGLGGTARSAEKDVRDFYALDIARLQNETALAAKNLFFNVLYTQALVATQQEQVSFAQENVRITESRLRNGVVSRFDVLTAQAALATAQQQLTAAQDQYQLAQSELSYLLGTDPDQPQTLQPPPLPTLDQSVDLRQSTRIALRQRPELGQASRNIDNARRQERLAGAGLLPTVGLVGSAEYTSNGSTITPRSYGTLSAQVAVPLDDGGLTRSRVRSARSTVQTQAVTQGQIQASVALEVRQATINIRNAQAEAAAAQVSVARSQEALRLAQERYGAGLGTFLDVLNALAQLATARTNLANAQYFYQSSLAQLVRAMGGR